MDKYKFVKCAQTPKISKGKDGGDSRRSSCEKERSKNETPIFPKRNFDRGDSKRKQNERKLSPVSDKTTNTNKVTIKTEKYENRTRNSNEFMDRRKRLRERYTFRYNQTNNNVVINTAHCSTDNMDDDGSDSDNKDKNIIRVVTRKLTDKLHAIEDDVDSGIHECLKMIEKKKEEVERKAIVKTITSQDNTKVYKAVTFVDRKKTTPIQIKLPRQQKDSKIPRLDYSRNKVKNVPSKQSIELKKPKVIKARMHSIYSRTSVDKEKRKLRGKKPMSPRFPVLKDPPTTEVAKWAPCSIDCHTRPYYEAWVDTTLTAICKETKDSDTKKILKEFKKMLLEKTESEELMYKNFADEKYAGRIKIRQRA